MQDIAGCLLLAVRAMIHIAPEHIKNDISIVKGFLSHAHAHASQLVYFPRLSFMVAEVL